MKKSKVVEQLFSNLKGDLEATVIESVCTKCFQSGETRILMTKIPFFRQILVMSFYCDSCGNKNTQIQFAGQLPDYGVEILFKAMNKTDLNREVIISQHARIKIQELQLQMPKFSKAQITTFEGLLIAVEQDLLDNQEQRKQKQPQRLAQILQFVQKLRKYSSGQKFPLTIRINDPSGNSFIKNPYAPKQDKNLQVTSVSRTLEQLVAMGYNVQNAQQQIKQIQGKKMGNKINFTKPFEQKQFMKYQPVNFDVPCHSCQMPGQMKMCQTSIPYFTDMIIMSFVCQYCGAHSTQTKNTGDIKDQGCIITLKASGDEDLKRDLFKSETCKLDIPQLQLQLDYGTLGGVFTTVQGLLEKISDHLGQNNPFADSDTQFHDRMQKLLEQIQQLSTGKRAFTLILTDPFGHSFLQNPIHPSPDPRATRVLYKRTEQQMEIMGLNDMKTQNYQQNDNKSQKSGSSMKKSKDRKYSQGSVESIEQIKNNQTQYIKSNNSLQASQIKFTKQSPIKPKEQEAPRKLSHKEENNKKE